MCNRRARFRALILTALAALSAASLCIPSGAGAATRAGAYEVNVGLSDQSETAPLSAANQNITSTAFAGIVSLGHFAGQEHEVGAFVLESSDDTEVKTKSGTSIAKSNSVVTDLSAFYRYHFNATGTWVPYAGVQAGYATLSSSSSSFGVPQSSTSTAQFTGGASLGLRIYFSRDAALSADLIYNSDGSKITTEGLFLGISVYL